MERFPPHIVGCYLYPITRYGYPPPAADTRRHLEEFRALGFRSVELEGIHEAHLLQIYEQRQELAALLRDMELSVPYFCAVLPELSAPDAATRRHQLRLFRRGCEVAVALGAEGVLDNAPLPPYHFPDALPVTRHYGEAELRRAVFPPELEWRAYWRQLVDTWRTACDIAADHGLTVQLHPALGVLAANTDGFLLFAEAVDRPNLRFNFDTANMLVLKENLPLSLLRLQDYVDYIHLSDNRGDRVEHLAMGEGNIDWPAFFDTLHRIDFHGHFGIDIGGAESPVENLAQAYRRAATFVIEHLRRS